MFLQKNKSPLCLLMENNPSGYFLPTASYWLYSVGIKIIYVDGMWFLTCRNVHNQLFLRLLPMLLQLILLTKHTYVWNIFVSLVQG